MAMNLTKGDDSLLLSHKNLACTDIMMFILRDYNLGQIAFAVFELIYII